MQDLPSPSFRHARSITPDDGDGDDELHLTRKRLKIQALINTSGVHQGLLQMHENEGSWEARARLVELGGTWWR